MSKMSVLENEAYFSGMGWVICYFLQCVLLRIGVGIRVVEYYGS